MTYLAIFAVAMLLSLIGFAIVSFFDRDWVLIGGFLGIAAIVCFGLWGLLYLANLPQTPDATYPPPRIEFPTGPTP
jgi:uncharacterized membrane protein